MCGKCTEIDEQIARYKQLASRLLDKSVLQGIEEIIAKLLAAKELLHPPQE